MKRELTAIERVLTESPAKAGVAARDLASTEEGKALLAAVAQEAGVTIILLRGGREIDRLVLLAGASGGQFSHVAPGAYAIALETGRVLWERTLTAADVIAIAAFPNQALPAAAQTEAFDQKPTIIETVGEGALSLRVFAGRESGSIACVLAPHR